MFANESINKINNNKFFFFYKCLYSFLSIRMSIELAAKEDVTKTLCERESQEQANKSMKEKAIPVF